jgi:hypothetical protein
MMHWPGALLCAFTVNFHAQRLKRLSTPEKAALTQVKKKAGRFGLPSI